MSSTPYVFIAWCLCTGTASKFIESPRVACSICMVVLY